MVELAQTPFIYNGFIEEIKRRRFIASMGDRQLENLSAICSRCRFRLGILICSGKRQHTQTNDYANYLHPSHYEYLLRELSAKLTISEPDSLRARAPARSARP